MSSLSPAIQGLLVTLVPEYEISNDAIGYVSQFAEKVLVRLANEAARHDTRAISSSDVESAILKNFPSHWSSSIIEDASSIVTDNLNEEKDAALKQEISDFELIDDEKSPLEKPKEKKLKENIFLSADFIESFLSSVVPFQFSTDGCIFLSSCTESVLATLIQQSCITLQQAPPSSVDPMVITKQALTETVQRNADLKHLAQSLNLEEEKPSEGSDTDLEEAGIEAVVDEEKEQEEGSVEKGEENGEVAKEEKQERDEAREGEKEEASAEEEEKEIEKEPVEPLKLEPIVVPESEREEKEKEEKAVKGEEKEVKREEKEEEVEEEVKEEMEEVKEEMEEVKEEMEEVKEEVEEGVEEVKEEVEGEVEKVKGAIAKVEEKEEQVVEEEEEKEKEKEKMEEEKDEEDEEEEGEEEEEPEEPALPKKESPREPERLYTSPPPAGEYYEVKQSKRSVARVRKPTFALYGRCCPYFEITSFAIHLLSSIMEYFMGYLLLESKKVALRAHTPVQRVYARAALRQLTESQNAILAAISRAESGNLFEDVLPQLSFCAHVILDEQEDEERKVEIHSTSPTREAGFEKYIAEIVMYVGAHLLLMASAHTRMVNSWLITSDDVAYAVQQFVPSNSPVYKLVKRLQQENTALSSGEGEILQPTPPTRIRAAEMIYLTSIIKETPLQLDNQLLIVFVFLVSLSLHTLCCVR